MLVGGIIEAFYVVSCGCHGRWYEYVVRTSNFPTCNQELKENVEAFIDSVNG